MENRWNQYNFNLENKTKIMESFNNITNRMIGQRIMVDLGRVKALEFVGTDTKYEYKQELAPGTIMDKLTRMDCYMIRMDSGDAQIIYPIAIHSFIDITDQP